MSDPRGESRERRALLWWILAGILGVVVAWRYFFVAFPEASVDFRISRPAAVERARQFLADQGFRLARYDSSIVFRVDNNAKTYLEREVGLEQANRLMASEVSVWYWEVRFFRPKQQEEFSVQVDPAGRVVGMRHVLEEAREGPQLSGESARTVAEEFLRSRLRIDLQSYDFLPEEANSTERPKRRDWSFAWERRGFKAKEAPYRLRVTVLGDAAGGYDEFLKVPEAWERDFARLRSSNELYQWLGQVPYGFLQFGAVLGVLYLLHTRGQVRWRGALKLGLVLAALFFVMSANEWPLTRSSYDTNSDYTGFVLGRFLLVALGSLLAGVVVSLTVAAGEPLYRHDHPEKLRLGAALTPAGFRSKEFFRSCVVGLAMAAAHIGFVVAFYVVGKAASSEFWVPQEIKYTDAVSTALPWIYPLAISLYAATSEEFLFRLFAIPYLMRLTKSRVVAVVLPALIWGFLHSAYPVQPGWARGVEVGLIGVVAGWVMLRWGIWATLVWHYTVDALLIGLFLLRSESLYFRLSGAVVAGVVLLPITFAVATYLSRRRFSDASALLNRAQPVVLAPVAEMVAPTQGVRTYTPTAPRVLAAVAIAGLAGLALAARVRPEAIGSYVRFVIAPGQAATQADEVLRRSNVDPARYRRVVVFHATFDPYASEYLRRRIGISGANQLYREKLPAAFWKVRYFRDSEKEEYAVTIRVDGGVHSVHHQFDEKAAGATLSKDEARARGEAYLRETKKLDLGQWKLVEATSDKRPARTDHTLVWEELAGVGDARLRAELKVLGDEVSGYRMFVKIPEEWRRKQKETTLAEISFLAIRILVGLSAGIAVLVLFFQNVRKYHVPWRRMALWAVWASLGFLVTLLGAWSRLLERYPTEIPLRTFTTILVLAQFLLVAFVFSAFLFLFAFALLFLVRAFGDARLPAWRGMPAAYYRDALWLALGGAGTLLGLGRLRALLESRWPTDRELLPAGVPQSFDAWLPAAHSVAQAVLASLFLVGLIAMTAALVAGYVKQRWMRLGLLAIAAVLLGGSVEGPAAFASGVLLALVNLGVLWFGVTRVFRFNLLAYFLTAMGLSLGSAAVELLRQPSAFFRLNGHAVVAAGLVLLAWPVLAGWRRGGTPADAAGEKIVERQ